MVVCAALVGVATTACPASASAASESVRPAEVLRRFVAAVNEQRPDMCDWLAPALVEGLAHPGALGLDPLLVESWGEANQLRSCSAAITWSNDLVAADEPRWRRATVLSVRFVERRRDAVRLRARLRHVYERPSDDRVRWVDVFLLRQPAHDAWRLATLGGVLRIGGRPPATFAAFVRQHALLARYVRRSRAIRARRIRDHLAFRSPLDVPGTACAGPASGVADPAGDVAVLDGARPRPVGAVRVGVDIRSLRLRSEGRRLCVEIRLAGPPPDGLWMQVTFHPGLRPDRRALGAGMPDFRTLRVRLDGEWAYAEREQTGDFGGLVPIPLRLSVVGDVVAFELLAREAVGPMADRPFVWAVSTRLGGHDDLRIALSDDVVARGPRWATGMIRHTP